MKNDTPPVTTACRASATCTNRAETWRAYPSLGRFPVCGLHAALLRAQSPDPAA